MHHFQDGIIRLIFLRDGWSKNIQKPYRFLLLAAFSYLAYSLWLLFDGFSVESVDQVIGGMFADFQGIAIGLAYFVWALAGLYLSIVAGAIAKSLFPDP